MKPESFEAIDWHRPCYLTVAGNVACAPWTPGHSTSASPKQGTHSG